MLAVTIKKARKLQKREIQLAKALSVGKLEAELADAERRGDEIAERFGEDNHSARCARLEADILRREIGEARALAKALLKPRPEPQNVGMAQVGHYGQKYMIAPDGSRKRVA